MLSNYTADKSTNICGDDIPKLETTLLAMTRKCLEINLWHGIEGLHRSLQALPLSFQWPLIRVNLLLKAADNS